MSSIGALNNGRELGITHSCLYSGCTNRPRANAHFYNIGTGKEQLLNHLTGNNVSGNNNLINKLLSHLLQKGNKVL
ncbi:hypothetical protein SDC9_91797 [bioreactor metagenome]|uniref:Uncharacterized protein n=1 Tax=bioreactor metagenome TaxID=1076179 RepID=A0A644ZW92_9ZZZZ